MGPALPAKAVIAAVAADADGYAVKLSDDCPLDGRFEIGSMTRSMRRLEREGFRRVFRLRGMAEVDGAQVVREPSWSDKSGRDCDDPALRTGR